jgi:hypothetical protein
LDDKTFPIQLLHDEPRDHQRDGSKEMQMPDGAQLLRSTDSARVKALALPFR